MNILRGIRTIHSFSLMLMLSVFGLVILGLINVQLVGRVHAQVNEPHLTLTTPTYELNRNEDFEVDLLFSTAGMPVESMDAKIIYNPIYIEVVDIETPNEPKLPWYQAKDYASQEGLVYISASIPYSPQPPNPTPSPVIGDDISVASISFRTKNMAGASAIEILFNNPPTIPPNTNDSNLISPNEQGDPVDILAHVDNLNIFIDVPPISPTQSVIGWDLDGSGLVDVFDYSWFIKDFLIYSHTSVIEFVSEFL